MIPAYFDYLLFTDHCRFDIALSSRICVIKDFSKSHGTGKYRDHYGHAPSYTPPGVWMLRSSKALMISFGLCPSYVNSKITGC